MYSVIGAVLYMDRNFILQNAVFFEEVFYVATEDMGYIELCAVHFSEESENFTVTIYLTEGTNDCSVQSYQV